MRLRYVRWKQGPNFGDDLNDVLFPDLFSIHESADNTQVLTDGVNFLGIGTLLNGYLRISGEAQVVVVGTGAGGIWKHPSFPRAPTISFVRGPLTCQYLELDPALGLADAAYLLAAHITSVAATGELPRRPYGIVPHHASMIGFADRWAPLGNLVIDPRQDWKSVVQQIAACDLILTECLHGAIAADILRIPSIAFAVTPLFHAFKWMDWAASMDIALSLHAFDFADPQMLCRTGRPMLSPQTRLHTVFDQLEDKKRSIRETVAQLAERAPS